LKNNLDYREGDHKTKVRRELDAQEQVKWPRWDLTPAIKDFKTDLVPL